MRRWHALAVVVPMVAGCPGPSGGGSTAVQGPEARRLVAAGATLLDVRTPEEFSDAHLEGARNIPVSDLGARMGEVPRGRPVVVYCASGARSASATSMLRAAGYDARNLGMMSSW